MKDTMLLPEICHAPIRAVRISDFSDVSNGSDWSADILVKNAGEEKTQRAKGAETQRRQTTSSSLRLCAFCG